MRAIRNKKGFSLVEMLIVLFIVALLLLWISFEVLQYLDRARGTVATAESRSVYITAQWVLAEYYGKDVGLNDRDRAEGLSGAVDNILYPVQTAMSRRMNELLAPSIELGAEPVDGMAKAEFTVEGGQVTKLIYQAEYGGRLYQATVVPGEDAVIERIG